MKIKLPPFIVDNLALLPSSRLHHVSSSYHIIDKRIIRTVQNAIRIFRFPTPSHKVLAEFLQSLKLNFGKQNLSIIENPKLPTKLGGIAGC